MSSHRLYGVSASDIASAASFLGNLLGCSFQERESDYLGVYWLGRVGSSTVKVLSQPDPEGENLEEEFAEFGTLIYIDGGSEVPHLDGERFGSNVIEALRSDSDSE